MELLKRYLANFFIIVKNLLDIALMRDISAAMVNACSGDFPIHSTREHKLSELK